MKKIGNKLKIFGIIAAALMVLMAFHPLVAETINIFGIIDLQTTDQENNIVDIEKPVEPIDMSVLPQPNAGQQSPGFPSVPDAIGSSNSNAFGFTTGLGPDSIGPALHVEITTGNVHTQLHICPEFSIRYNSLKSHVKTPLGYGWTHSLNIYLRKVYYWNCFYGVRVVDGNGFETFYRKIGDEYIRPPGATADLLYEIDHYVLKYFDGSEIHFNENNYIDKYITQYGQIERFIYNTEDLLTTISNPYGQTITLDYYDDGRLKFVTDDQTGETTEFIYYNNEDYLTQVIDPLDNNVFYDYEDGSRSRLSSETLKNGVIYICEYDDAWGHQSRTIKDSEDKIIVMVSASSFPTRRRVPTIPEVVLVTDGNENEWEHTRNRFAKRTMVKSPDGYTCEVEYYDNGRGMVKWEKNARSFERFYEYDEWDNLIRITSYDGEKYHIIEYDYKDDDRFHTLLETVDYADIKWAGLDDPYDAERLSNGNTLITERGRGRVIEVDGSGEIVWQKTGLYEAVDAERLSNGNTLITLMNDHRVIEVDGSGEIVWEKNVGLPYDAERLSNGNTLITKFSGSVIEVDGSGEIVWQKTGLYEAVDAERLSNGNTLITENGRDRVIEVDSSGGIVWEKTGLHSPLDAERLSNGNTLIIEYCLETSSFRVIEVDSSGDIVWEKTRLDLSYDAERLSNGNTLITECSNGRVIEVYSNFEFTFTYYETDDARGRLKSVTDPDDKSTTYDYEFYTDNPDLPGRVKKITRTDPNNHIAIWEYDNLGGLVKKIIDPDGLALVVEYEYDPDTHRLSKKIMHRGADDGIETYYEHYPIGRLKKRIVDYGGLDLTISWTYDESGNVKTITDPRENVTKFVYDYRDRLKHVIRDFDEIDGLNLETSFDYDGNDNLITLTDPGMYQIQFDYENQNWLENITDAKNFFTQYEYDEVGNVKRMTRWLEPSPDIDNPNEPCYTVTMDYDGLNRLESRIVVVDPAELSLETQYGYVERLRSDGTLSSLVHNVTDAEDNVIYYYYDNLGRMRLIVQKIGDTADNEGDDDDDVTTRFFYDDKGNLEWIIGPEGENMGFVYDAADRLIKQTQYNSGDDLITEFDYEEAGYKVVVTLPNENVVTVEYDNAYRLSKVSDLVDPDGFIQKFTYDANGNVETVTDAKSRIWSFEYDALDRMIKSFDPMYLDKPDIYVYDNNSRLERLIDKNDVVTKYVHNGLGWVTQVIRDFEGEDAATADTTTSYEFNGLGLVTKLLDHGGNTTNYFYDGAVRLCKIAYPGDDGEGDDHVTFTHDRVGNVKTRIDQKDHTTEYVYDELYRLKDVIYYEASEMNVHYEYDKFSRLKTASNDFASWEFDYDDLGRLKWQEQENTGLAGGPYRTDFDYEIGPVSRTIMTYPGGRQVVSSSDMRLRPIGVSSDDGISGIWAFNLANELTDAVLGNGFISEFKYDDIGRVTNINHTFNSILEYGDEYGYDPVGNRLFTRKLHDSENSELYEYNNLNRLIGFERGQLNDDGTAIEDQTTSPFLNQDQLWLLDRKGNWPYTAMHWYPDGFDEETRTANEVNEYTFINDEPLHHDDNGNLRDDGTYTYVYDMENRLIEIKAGSETLRTFAYGPLGLRVKSIDADGIVTHHLFVGFEEIQERDSDGVLLREYIPGATGKLAMVDYTEAGDQSESEAEVLYYLHDILGSVVVLTDANGVAVEWYHYEPYGETIITNADGTQERSESLFGNSFMWTGQRYDAGVGLYLFYARTYMPGLGRWLSRDPLGYVDGTNLYEYCRSSPLNYVDPLGLAAIETVESCPNGGAQEGEPGEPGGGDDPPDGPDPPVIPEPEPDPDPNPNLPPWIPPWLPPWLWWLLFWLFWFLLLLPWINANNNVNANEVPPLPPPPPEPKPEKKHLDSDGDGIPDYLDAYPHDPDNGYNDDDDPKAINHDAFAEYLRKKAEEERKKAEEERKEEEERNALYEYWNRRGPTTFIGGKDGPLPTQEEINEQRRRSNREWADYRRAKAAQMGRGSKQGDYSMGRSQWQPVIPTFSQTTNKPRCFPEEELVVTSNGMVPIVNLEKGNKIVGLSGRILFNRILQVEKQEVHEGCFPLYELILGEESLRVTDGHRFLLEDGHWIPTEYLHSGDYLKTLNGRVRIDRINYLGIVGPMKVYNLKVENGETYAVSELGIIVRDW